MILEYDCLKKIQNLRTYYIREFNKENSQKSGQATEENYKSKWPFFNSLSFLKPSFKKRPSVSSLTQEEPIEDSVIVSILSLLNEY